MSRTAQKNGRFVVSDDLGEVGSILLRPAGAEFLFVLAHGAGAGMTHPFLESLAEALATEKIATLRFQFPYMEAGRKRPDTRRIAQATVRAAAAWARRQTRGLRIVAGGKSFGGRMSSHAQAEHPMPGVEGLVFVGFPLHAPGKPSTHRADHLSEVQVPMLFLQGTRDSLADLGRIRTVVDRLPQATLHVVEGGDHSFHVLKRSGRAPEEVRAELVESMRDWLKRL